MSQIERSIVLCRKYPYRVVYIKDNEMILRKQVPSKTTLINICSNWKVFRQECEPYEIFFEPINRKQCTTS